jgi:hypothetical protein
MKINEIAINEGIEKLGKYVFNTAKNAWELANDTKALSKGGVKSADNLVSPAELSALRRDPTPPSSGPAVWRKRGDPNFDTTPGTLQGPSTGGTIPKPIVPAPKPRANTSAYDQEVRKAHDMNPSMPNKGKPSSEAEKYLELKQAQAARTAAEKQAAADDLARQVSPGADPPMTSGGQAAPEMIAEPLPSWLSPKGAKGSKTTGGRQEPSINRPADDLAKQIKPGAEAPKTPGGRQEPSMSGQSSGENKFSMDDVERIAKLVKSDPVAAKAAAEEAGIPWGKVLGYGTLAAAAIASPAIYNKTKPEWAPAAPSWLDVTNAVKITPADGSTPAATPVYTPPAADWPAAAASAAQPAPTNDPTVDEIKAALENDPKWQDLQRQKKELGIDESTKLLNRMVFLSRL